MMSRNPITISADTGIKDAANIMLEKNISCLPVVSPQNEIEGIITNKDILNYYANREKGREK